MTGADTGRHNGARATSGRVGATTRRTVGRLRTALATTASAVAAHPGTGVGHATLVGLAGPPPLLQVLCHEVRTPIASVQALADALGREGVGSDDDRREMARLIADHARHLAAVIDAVAVVTAVARRSQWDDGPAPPTVTDVTTIVAGAASAAAVATGSLRVQVEKGLTVADADVAVVRRVLTNLLENARVHGGDPYAVAVHRRAGHLLLVVGDAGAGLPPAVRRRLERPLATRRSEVAPSPAWNGSGPGSGLGLWIVEQLVASRGGSLGALPATRSHATRIAARIPVAPLP